jgi:hypothetical protein
MNIKIKKKTWIKLIQTGLIFNANENNGKFSLGNHLNRKILNWNNLYFYLQYQLVVYKNIVLQKGKVILATDKITYAFVIKKIAFKINALFIIGPWFGGTLTEIKWYKQLPSCVLILGMQYPKTIYNETAILGLPCINFIENIGKKKYFLTNYVLPYSNMNTIIFQKICCLFVYIYKKYNIINIYKVFPLLQQIDPIFEDRLKGIFNKIQYFKQTLHYWEPTTIFIKSKVKKIALLAESFDIIKEKLNCDTKYKFNLMYKTIKQKNKFQLVLLGTQILMKKTLLNLDFININLFKKNFFFWIQNYELHDYNFTSKEVINVFETDND